MVSYSEGVKLLAARKICASTTARKFMHVGCGPIFLLCWPLFSQSSHASSFAMVAPLALTSFFTLVGLGIAQNQATVQSMSRTGARQELLRGPFLYGSVMIVATLVYWRHLTAALCISCLCAGDGFADLIGRRYAPLAIQNVKHDDDGKKLIWQSEPQLQHHHHDQPQQQQQQQQQQQRGRIPWCRSKSWVGTLGFIAASVLTSFCLAAYFQYHGWIAFAERGRRGVGERVWGATLLSAAAETLPVPEGWDNVVVFVAVVLADWLVMRGRGEGL